MKLKLLIFGLLAAISSTFAAKADTYFPYPIVPDSISTFQGRCNYLVNHFWDFCDLTKAFSARHKMADEFAVYVSLLRNASPQVALSAVKDFTSRLNKQPKDQIFIAECAEELLYGDSAEFHIDNLYIPFAQAVADNKKIDKASKARYAHHAKVLTNSRLRQPFPHISATTRSGQPYTLSTDSAQMVILFFNDPDCSDCNLARIRIDADIILSGLIESGLAKVIAISLSDPDDGWKNAVSGYPTSWDVVAAPDADMEIDLRFGTPDFYILDTHGRIRFKHISVDQITNIARQLNLRSKEMTKSDGQSS